MKVRDVFSDKMRVIYPNGLEGRSVLDCGCNCAECLLWAKELGAGECFGFDVREHWIKQARFLLKHSTAPTDGIRVEVCDLYDLPGDLEPFDLTLFHGLFYHLPAPVAGLKIAADLTKELLILDTAVLSDLPAGLLAVGQESREALLSGVHGLCWYPAGPDVLTRILNWTGFVEAQVHWWTDDAESGSRLEIFASKKPGLLEPLNVPTIRMLFELIDRDGVAGARRAVQSYSAPDVEFQKAISTDERVVGVSTRA